ncbi:hypothetical protein PG994_004983 [Apiospora phragmitis]|uniref:Uncharacterized protein n=1 Tax=Apiospora phragmitis TaxID=2905665 RepID=A0ABR1VS46_9PEZI
MAEEAFQTGFRDIDYDSCYGTPPLTHSQNPEYTLWLLEHGADPKRRINSRGELPVEGRGTISAHYMMYNIVSLAIFMVAHSAPAHQRAVWRVIAMAGFIQVADFCSCACSSGGCTPFICMMKGCSVIRFDAFERLGLTHTCCWRPVCRRRVIDDAEVLEIQEEEEARLLNILNDIVEDFEGKVKDISNDLEELYAFRNDYWRCHVEPVLDNLADQRMTEEERQEAEAIGIKWWSDRYYKGQL